MDNIPLDNYILVFSGSLVLSLVLTGLSILILKKFNVMDIPDARKIHTRPIPRMGGVAVYLSFVIPMLCIRYYDDTQKGVVIGAGIALIIGAIDDIWHVPATIKLISLFLLTLLIWKFGVITKLPLGFMGIPSEAVNLLITMLWLAGICSAINALDHMDGLAGGVALIATISYLAVSLHTGQYFWGLLSISLAGSLIGFLFYNRHPAKIFMGDSGSFFLGFSLAAIGIMGGWSENPIKAAIIPIAILSVPIFDMIYILVSRLLNGTTKSLKEAIVYCGKDHIGHRLCDMGFCQVNAARIVYLIASTIAISALIIRDTLFPESILLLLQIVMVYIMLIIFMKNLVIKENRKSGQ